MASSFGAVLSSAAGVSDLACRGRGLLLLAASLLVLRAARTRPYLVFGWIWYLVTLLPVIGLIQVGHRSHADRYTYVPSIGVFALLVWGAHDLTRRCRFQPLILSALVLAVTLPCIALTRRQLHYWKDSETLVRHGLEVSENNEIAHGGLGILLARKGQIDQAIREFQTTLRLNPRWAEAHYNLGILLVRKGRIDEAIDQYQEAIRLYPDYAEAYNNLGIALSRKGQMDEAARQFQEATRRNPDYAEAHYNLGLALGLKGQIAEAISHFEAALKANPNYPEAHIYLGAAFRQRGQTDEAIRQFQEALKLKPDDANARKNLDAALASKAHASPPPGTPANP